MGDTWPRTERFIEWYGLTCTDLMRSSGRLRNYLGVALAFFGLIPVLMLLAVWLAVGKKPRRHPP